jgi:transcriptional regulator with XRE-family HTH domain
MAEQGPESGVSEGFGVMLRALRERAELSQSALARLAGLDPSFINRLESGRRGVERPVADALALALHLSVRETDRLLAAGGFLPPSLMKVGLDDPTLQLVVEFLTREPLSSDDRAAFHRAVADARQGLGDPTLRLVEQILSDERLSTAEREAFRQVIDLIGRRWQSEGGDQ